MTSTILDIEQIEWRSATEELPYVDTVVLIHAPGSDEPVWLGHYDGVYWFAVGGEGYGDEDEIPDEVTAWAMMPTGPQQ